MKLAHAIAIAGLLLTHFAARGQDFAARCADRAALERVYHAHRTGTKQPFEEAMPRALLERLVRADMQKELVLRKTFGVEITPAMVAAEVQRINTTTRAPEMLAEIKHALGGDAARFAEAMARPIIVERALRERFDNDDALHAPQRREVERVRTELTNAAAAFHLRRPAATTNELVGKLLALLKQNHSNEVSETTWQLAARPAETNAPNADEIEIKKRFGSGAQILSSPHDGDGKERKFYFADLPPELQRVLRIQLRQPGDVSAVIEMPNGFLLYLAKEKTAETLSVATLCIPKRSYEQWLAEQTTL